MVANLSIFQLTPAHTYYRQNELWFVSRRDVRSRLQPAVDLFSFGALVFYMLTQSQLFAPLQSQAEESETASLLFRHGPDSMGNCYRFCSYTRDTLRGRQSYFVRE